MIQKYYINFKPEANIQYLSLFSLYDLAEYNVDTKSFDSIKYTSISKLSDSLSISRQKLDRLLSNPNY